MDFTALGRIVNKHKKEVTNLPAEQRRFWN
jgi:hypothetical protein